MARAQAREKKGFAAEFIDTFAEAFSVYVQHRQFRCSWLGLFHSGCSRKCSVRCCIKRPRHQHIEDARTNNKGDPHSPIARRTCHRRRKRRQIHAVSRDPVPHAGGARRCSKQPKAGDNFARPKPFDQRLVTVSLKPSCDAPRTDQFRRNQCK
jgi:hypothetical protein